MNDINIGQFAEALNDKMDRDSDNANPAVAKQSDLATLQTTIEQLQATITSLQGELSKMLGRPDYYGNIITTTITSNKNTTGTYTIPEDGYFKVTTCNVGSNKTSIKVNNITLVELNSDSSINVGMSFGDYIFVSIGDILTLPFTASVVGSNTQTATIQFIPQKS